MHAEQSSFSWLPCPSLQWAWPIKRHWRKPWRRGASSCRLWEQVIFFTLLCSSMRLHFHCEKIHNFWCAFCSHTCTSILNQLHWKTVLLILTLIWVCSCWRENEVEEVKEEGPKEMTLDEWKAMQDKDRAKVEFNIRKPNEGADWNKGFVLHKSKAEVSKNKRSALGWRNYLLLHFNRYPVFKNYSSNVVYWHFQNRWDNSLARN